MRIDWIAVDVWFRVFQNWALHAMFILLAAMLFAWADRTPTRSGQIFALVGSAFSIAILSLIWTADCVQLWAQRHG
jgi:hypothetical protein